MKFSSCILLLASVVATYAQGQYESETACGLICPDKCTADGAAKGYCQASGKSSTGAQLYDCYCESFPVWS
ncbi:hypothetical protein N0V93_001160 [Gnomoniopsis smithogilvyi]|uniref:Uncharacterized protein n=1 Tax=Gnomoniopsis smithogilvyi TaxID=1191159 RepID=A0A9W8Z3D3_9PEZI|nr:hypothetical protein N0V93_001160 [Gnomoniopsis smithogilvyi]